MDLEHDFTFFYICLENFVENKKNVACIQNFRIYVAVRVTFALSPFPVRTPKMQIYTGKVKKLCRRSQKIEKSEHWYTWLDWNPETSKIHHLSWTKKHEKRFFSGKPIICTNRWCHLVARTLSRWICIWGEKILIFDIIVSEIKSVKKLVKTRFLILLSKMSFLTFLPKL